jgi:hypothetical protein
LTIHIDTCVCDGGERCHEVHWLLLLVKEKCFVFAGDALLWGGPAKTKHFFSCGEPQDASSKGEPGIILISVVVFD